MAAEHGCKLRRIEDERRLELIGHFGQAPHHGAHQPDGTQCELRRIADTDRVTDVIGDQVEHRSSRDGLRPGQVPYLTDGAVVSAKCCQSGRDVGDIAVGVGKTRVADEVRVPPRQCLCEYPLTERRFRDAGAEEVRRPPDGDTDASRRCGVKQLPGHGRPGAALDGGGSQGEVFRHRLAAGGSVSVDVLQTDKQGIGAFGRGNNAPL
jgi:hypothetical protein